ncbi:MAG: phage fiber-tail adaptor protein [bacterium]
MTTNPNFVKDPDAILDFKFDWKALTNGTGNSDWLDALETISTHTVSVSPTGLTVDSSSITDSSTSVTVWLSGGTADTTYEVTCEIVTDNSRTDQRTIRVYVRER